MAEKVQTIKEIHQTLSQMFGNLYPSHEASSLAALIAEEFTGYGRARQMASGNDPLTVSQQNDILRAAKRVSLGEPLQYVLGYTIFCGHRINVSPAVLIPRPETEELTSMIISENKGFSGTAVDYCTGSGCIAVSLALAFPDAEINATDISPDAINVAQGNATLNNATVRFYLSDLLGRKQEDYSDTDIIVSNPPYVRESEKKYMRNNVLAHEPQIALFVSDSDPLIFYKRLAEKALLTLKKGGKIYLEINEALGDATSMLFSSDNYREVRVIKDLYGRDRFIKAEKR